MRIIGIVAVMLILVSVSSGYWWDTEKILQGQQMLKTGAPSEYDCSLQVFLAQ